MIPGAVCTVFFGAEIQPKHLVFCYLGFSLWFFIGFLLSPLLYAQSFFKKTSFLVLAIAYITQKIRQIWFSYKGRKLRRNKKTGRVAENQRNVWLCIAESRKPSFLDKKSPVHTPSGVNFKSCGPHLGRQPIPSLRREGEPTLQPPSQPHQPSSPSTEAR
jgi:hypothetical protein